MKRNRSQWYISPYPHSTSHSRPTQQGGCRSLSSHTFSTHAHAPHFAPLSKTRRVMFPAIRIKTAALAMSLSHLSAIIIASFSAAARHASSLSSRVACNVDQEEKLMDSSECNSTEDKSQSYLEIARQRPQSMDERGIGGMSPSVKSARGQTPINSV